MIASAYRMGRRRPPGRPLVLLFAATLLSATPASAGDKAEPTPVALATTVLQLDPEDPKRDSIGRLIWRGGIEITSDAKRFGGLSGLLVSGDGARLLAVSDRGSWLSARLRYDAEGRLVGLDDGQMARLRDLDGEAISKKRLRDAEDLAELADGSILVSFEDEHRIWRYDTDHGRPMSRPTAWPKPEGLDQAPGNSGLEALTDLAGGGLLALTEDQDAGAAKAGYLWRDGAWSRLTYLPEANFKPTSAHRVPGSDDVLVLERTAQVLGGFNVRLVRIAARDIRPGAELRGELLARWGAPFTIDNFEALAARRAPDGQILVYLLSDDNFNAVQRTLLLMFALEE